MKRFIVLGREICLFFDSCIFIDTFFGKMLKRSKLSEAKWQIGMFMLKKIINSLHGQKAYFNLHQIINLHFKKLFYLKCYILKRMLNSTAHHEGVGRG
jgi:hypothetical protein